MAKQEPCPGVRTDANRVIEDPGDPFDGGKPETETAVVLVGVDPQPTKLLEDLRALVRGDADPGGDDLDA
jgi:hypothetical protein